MNGDTFDLMCDNDGNWNDNPVCTKVVCPAILPPPNARIFGSCTPGVVGETCTIKCNTGFKASDPTLLCTDDGWVWI